MIKQLVSCSDQILVWNDYPSHAYATKTVLYNCKYVTRKTWISTTPHCIPLYNFASQDNTLWYAVPHCTTLYCTVPHFTALYYTLPNCSTLTKLQHTSPHCTILYKTVAHCTKLHHFHHITSPCPAPQTAVLYG